MGWKAIAKSAQGTKYARANKPCQDFAHYLDLGIDNIIIGAVSDGAGSAKYSYIGSELAVGTAINYLQTVIQGNYDQGYNWQQPLPQDFLIGAFRATIRNVLQAFQYDADHSTQSYSQNPDAIYAAVSNQESYSPKDLACTLLLFIATPTWLTAMQIGDGFIVIKQKDVEDYQLIFEPDRGEYAGQTTFVTSPNAIDRMQVEVISGNQEFICASTDGLERLAMGNNLRLNVPFFNAFKELIRDDQDTENKSLEDWLDSPKVNAKADDDKTLLICLYSQEVNPKDPPIKEDQIKRIKLGNLSVSFPTVNLSRIKTPFLNKKQQKKLPSPNEKAIKNLKKIELERILPISFLAGILWNANYTLWVVNRNSQYRNDWISNLIILALTILILLIAFNPVYKNISNKKNKIKENIQEKQKIYVDQAARKTIFFHILTMIISMAGGALIYHLLWLFSRYQINY